MYKYGLVVMAKGPVLQPVFKAYHQRQGMLLPPSLDELIAINHPVRVVDEVLSKIDIQPFFAADGVPMSSASQIHNP